MADAVAVKKEKSSETVSLTFSKPDEIEVYNDLLKAAEDKDYTLSKFIVRVLTGKETLDASETN